MSLDAATPIRFDRRVALAARRMIVNQANLSSTLIGPYGLHAVLGGALVLFAGFLYLFNFTSFF